MIAEVTHKLATEAYIDNDSIFQFVEKFQSRKKPDAIIVGEYHHDYKHGLLEAKLIKHYKPEYIVIERHAPFQIAKERYKKATLQVLSKTEGFTLDELGFDQVWLERHYFEHFKTHSTAVSQGVMPRNYDELITTPFYLFDSRVQRTLISILEKRRLEIIKLVVNASFDTKAQYIAQFGRHEEKIEAFENCAQYLRRLTTPSAEAGLFRTSRILYHALSESNAVIIPGDIDIRTDTAKEFVEHARNPRRATRELLELVNPYRERFMGAMVREAVKQRKTDAPVIAIFGRYHTRRSSGIFTELKKCRINYRTLNPASLSTEKQLLTYWDDLVKTFAPSIKLKPQKNQFQELLEELVERTLDYVINLQKS